MIIRIWEGATNKENAAAYERLLQQEVFPAIAGRNVKGYKGIQLLRTEMPGHVNFMTFMRFEDWQSVKEFAGPDHEKSYVIDPAKKLLLRYDERARHFEVLYEEL